MENAVDFVPLADIVLQYLVILLTVSGGVFTAWLGKKVHEWFGLKIEEKHRMVLQDALEKSIQFGETRVRDMYQGKLTLSTKDDLIAGAAAYVAQSVPDALKKFKIDPATAEGRSKIINMVNARLNYWVFDGDKDENIDMSFDPDMKAYAAKSEAVTEPLGLGKESAGQGRDLKRSLPLQHAPNPLQIEIVKWRKK